MKFFTRILAALSTALLLASCGGGGGDGGAFTPAPATLVAVATPSSIAPLGATNVEVTAKKGDGSAVTDGTTISILLSPTTLATSVASVGTVGGKASFPITALDNTGTVRVTVSMADPGIANRTVTSTVDVTIAGTVPVSRMVAVASPTTITQGASSDIVVTFTKADGSNVADGTTISALASPASIGTIEGSAQTVGGKANFTFHSGTQNGTATIQFSGLDSSGATVPVTTSVTITVNGPAPAGVLTATATPTTITRNAQSSVLVTLSRANGDAVADGTVINATITPTSLGTITGDGAAGSTASNSTVGGSTNFHFNSVGQDGTVRITVSAVDPEDSSRTITATVQVVIAGNPTQARFTAVASPALVTRNAISNVLVTLQRMNGEAVADGTSINAVLSPANIGSIAGAENAGTTATNTTVGGRANFQFISGNIEGIATIVVSAVDPEDATHTLTATVTITVAGAAASRIVITPSLTSITQNASSDVAVVVTNRTGQPVADGSTVNLIVTPASIGTVSDAVGGTASNQATATTVGGRANFRFNSGSINGTATLTASSADPDVAGATLSASAQVTVSGTGVPRLSAVATTTLLPPNLLGIAPFIGSPYISEIDVTWRRANGQLVTGTQIAVSVNPVVYGGFSMLDDPTTDDINEFTTIMGQAPVDVVAGKATLFFHSFTLPGNATVTITAVDPDTQETLQTDVVITVAPSVVPLPSAITAVSQNSAVYVQDSGGRTSATLIAQVVDGADNPVPNPESGNVRWNNVAFELVNADGLGGARLRAIEADGSDSTGPRVLTRTINGQATASFESGTVSGGVTIRVVADRADNNVDNGVQDVLTASITLTVSDGKLYSIVLTSPTPNALTVNTVPGAGATTDPTSPNAGPRNAGNNDGTYSLTVSALATDRAGNPVIQGTALRFGVIDAPLYGFPDLGHGFFYLTGADGNPAEGASLFTAPTGQFTTAGGGAGPGDTLLVFGQLVTGNGNGNRDLQEARTVATVNSATSLTISSSFNPNDDSGSSVDNGAILPYVIGRATEANIGGDSGGTAVQAVTNAIGVATVTLNYPVTRLGKAAYLYAQGDRPGSTTRKVTGTAGIALPGARPAVVTASTTSLPGNVPASLVVCLRDANDEALQGYYLRFAFHDLGGGSGSVDNIPGTGVTATPTGSDGCLLALVSTSGLTSDDTDAGVIFSSGDADIVDVAITTSATAQNVVNVSPSSLGSDGGTVTIRVTDSQGTPLSGLPVLVECEATGDGARLTSTIPVATNASGTTTAVITATNFTGYGFSGSGKCTYSVGGSSAVVSVTGVDRCTPAGGAQPGSPPPSQCQLPEVGGLTLTLRTDTGNGAIGGGRVTSSPAGLSCLLVADQTTEACTGSFNVGTVVTLTASVIPSTPAGAFIGWSGGCSATANPLVATATISAASTCAAIFKGAP